MKRHFYLALFFGFLATPSLANQVTVSGGEHPGFTRMILNFERLPDWTTERIGRSQRITFSGDALSFDLSRAFRLIGRERVGEIRITEGGLEIDVACDCAVSVWKVAENALAADFRARQSDSPSVLKTIQPMTLPDISTSETALPNAGSSTQTQRHSPKPVNVPLGDDLFGSNVVDVLEMEEITLRNLDLLLDGADRSPAVELLGRELSRAAAQGLIDAESVPSDLSKRSMPFGKTELGDRSNFSVSTGIDRAVSPGLQRVPPTQNGAVCIPNLEVDVAGWGDASDPRALGRYRLSAVAENGDLDPKGSRMLAQYYLAMGFGAEARLAAASLAASERDLIFALADIMDHRKSDAKVLDGQIFCKGKVALWAALAAPFTATNQPISMDVILATFSALPPHLRSHLGPILSDRFRKAGLTEQSRAVVNAMTRGGDVTGESVLASARLDLEGISAEPARATLQSLSLGTDVTAAEALLELLEDAERREMAPNPDWVLDDVPSLVRAVEGTEVAGVLNIAGLRGRIALGMFDSFRSALAEDTPGLERQSRRSLAEMALQAAAETASNADFLETEIGLSRVVVGETLPEELRLGIAQRLADIGVAERAMSYLPNVPSSQGELVVLAEVLLATGKTANAIELLRAVESEEVATILGGAYLSNGDASAAITAFENAQQSEAAISSAFRAGNWDWISAQEDNDVSQAVRTLVDPQAEASPNNPNGSLIENSRVLRDQAKFLLGKTELTNF